MLVKGGVEGCVRYHVNSFSCYIYAMCRILGVVQQKPDGTELVTELSAFRALADCGCVPVGTPRGHRDGWGAVGYTDGKIIFSKRRVEDAYRDPQYPSAIVRLAREKPQIVLVHFRKASIGGKSIPNTHPFTARGYSFCHNGSIFETKRKRIALTAATERLIKGMTDSERFFLYLLERLSPAAPAATVRKTFIAAIRIVRKNFDYTAMNMLLTNGKTLWAVREVNTYNREVRQKKLLGYYTLFSGTDTRGGQTLVCSETLAIPAMRWKPIANHRIVEVDLRSTLAFTHRL
mgnify:CR=1 FL=1